MGFFTYILQSEKDGSFYIGSSQDPYERLKKHIHKHSGYTARKQPWNIVWSRVFATKSEALELESQIKNPSNKGKKASGIIADNQILLFPRESYRRFNELITF